MSERLVVSFLIMFEIPTLFASRKEVDRSIDKSIYVELYRLTSSDINGNIIIFMG